MHHGQREATSWLLHAGIHVSEAYEEVGTKAIRERPERSTGEPRELVWLGDRRLETKHWKEACDFQAFLAEESQSPVLCSTAWDFRNCLRQDVRPPPPPPAYQHLPIDPIVILLVHTVSQPNGQHCSNSTYPFFSPPSAAAAIAEIVQKVGRVLKSHSPGRFSHSTTCFACLLYAVSRQMRCEMNDGRTDAGATTSSKINWLPDHVPARVRPAPAPRAMGMEGMGADPDFCFLSTLHASDTRDAMYMNTMYTMCTRRQSMCLPQCALSEQPTAPDRP